MSLAFTCKTIPVLEVTSSLPIYIGANSHGFGGTILEIRQMSQPATVPGRILMIRLCLSQTVGVCH